jgi:hypothetical protein
MRFVICPSELLTQGLIEMCQPLKIRSRVSVGIIFLAVGWLFTQEVAAQPVPVISQQPQSQSALVGTNVSFAVVASGQAPLIYRWHFNNGFLTDGERVAGAGSATLQISNVLASDAGGYWVTVSNKHGVATSAVASLTVLVPAHLTAHPANQVTLPGRSVTFTAAAAGTGPLSYRWQKNGINLADGGRITGAASPALTLGNAQMSDVGATDWW